MDSSSCSDEETPTLKWKRVIIDYDLEDEVEEPLPFSDEDTEDNDENQERLFYNKPENVAWTAAYHSTGWHETRQKFDSCEKGFTVDASKICTPKDAFLEFVDDNMLKLLINFTTAEAEAAGDVSFKSVDKDLFLAWLACSINAGLFGSNHTSLDALWTTDSVNGTGFYRAVMSKHQYEAICRHIRFDDSVARRTPRQVGQLQAENYERPKDRLELIRPIMDIFQTNFRDKYRPGENCTVDERTISFRGRCTFKVYNKSKPDPYGLKLFGVSDSENFYFTNFDLYAGMNRQNIFCLDFTYILFISGKVNKTPEVGQGKRVVLQLTKPYFSSGRRIILTIFSHPFRWQKNLFRGIFAV